jgi:hypothetical protein
VAEAGVELLSDSAGKTQAGGRVVHNPVQVPADAVEIAIAVAKLPAKSRSALLALIKSSGHAIGTKEAKR